MSLPELICECSSTCDSLSKMLVLISSAKFFFVYSNKHFAREREAQRFQSAMSLYSNSLSALVLFTDKRLGYQTGLQKGEPVRSFVHFVLSAIPIM